MVWIILIFAAVILDQVTKYLIVSNIDFMAQITIIDNFFYITHWKNTGAAWGIMQNGRFLFIPLTIIVVVILFYILFKANNKMLKFSLVLIIGGAVGNLIDRTVTGSVVDFLQFYFGSYHFPIFNVADMMLDIGTAILMIYILFFQKKDGERKIEE